jgi:Peptidase C13 family
MQTAASALALCGLVMGGPADAADKKPMAKPGTQSIKIKPPPIKKRINVEKIYYSQFGLVTMATRRLAHERPGTPDLYFVGFGGDADQDVFLREVQSVRKLFDERFDTKERSVLLVNNLKTVTKLPLANSHNLLAGLDRMSGVMNVNEDVLFLFLTSHGTPDVLSVNFKPLRMNDLTAKNLKFVLDRSRVKWRVIVVSACYSGSFVDDLKDENSLIITAARGDRVSFGCDHKNDWTNFGRAYFDQALRGTFSFIDAFPRAAKTVGKWEKEQKLEPSLPQMHIGAAIKPKLREIEARLRKRYKSAKAGGGTKTSPQ